MGWVKLDDGFFRNPKILGVSRDAKLLYVSGLCYAGASLTDGFIPANAARSLAVDAEIASAAKAISQLVAAGLWEQTEGGYMIHDYLAHNTSATHVRAKRDAARDRMQRGRSPNVRANKSRSSQNVREPETEAETEQEKYTETPDGVSPSASAEDRAQRSVNRSTLDDRFERFWTACPRKVGREAALKWWHRTKPDEAFTGRMIAAMERHRQSPEWRKDGGTFIPHPATWLNRGGWEDELGPVETDDDAYVIAFGDDNIVRMATMLDRCDPTFAGPGWVRSTLRQLAIALPGLTPEQLKSGMAIGVDRIGTRFRQGGDKPVANPTSFAFHAVAQALREQLEVTP